MGKALHLLQSSCLCCCGWEKEKCDTLRADSPIPNIFMKMPKEAAAFRSHGQDLLLEPQTVENMLVEQEEE